MCGPARRFDSRYAYSTGKDTDVFEMTTSLSQWMVFQLRGQDDIRFDIRTTLNQQQVTYTVVIGGEGNMV